MLNAVALVAAAEEDAEVVPLPAMGSGEIQGWRLEWGRRHGNQSRGRRHHRVPVRQLQGSPSVFIFVSGQNLRYLCKLLSLLDFAKRKVLQ